MDVLGISAYYHDAGAAIVSDGKVVAAAAEERFTRQKHDANFPKFAIDFCLQTLGLDARELDRIVFYEEPHLKFVRVLTSALAPFPFSSGAFVRSMKSWLSEKLWIQNDISKRLDVHPNKIEFIPHHLSHAAQAFLGSGFSDAAILTVDAVGEWSCTSLYHGSLNEGLKFELLEEISYPHSLGLLYAAFTGFLGFRPNDGECSVMALAAFGKPTYAEKVRQIIRSEPDGSYRIDQSYFKRDQFGANPFSTKFFDTFGPPRGFKESLPFSCFSDHLSLERTSTNQQRFADIAASLQLVLEETLLNLISKLSRMTGSHNLCLAGGVALNCVANSRIVNESPFEEIFIPPDPGDGGAAVGAATYSYYSTRSDLSNFKLSPFLGKEYDVSESVKLVRSLDIDGWNSHRMRESLPHPEGMRLQTEVYESFPELIPRVVDDISRGKIVGWFQGRFENGPRALGNRSILINPGNIEVAKRLSKTVKQRASFRPYAFSIAEGSAGQVLAPRKKVAHTTKWMQSVEPINESAAPLVKAAIHIDGTTRVQICGFDDNPKYHELLSAYGQAAGLPALLNTSFNESGYPMIASPAEALIVFARTNMDTLVLNNVVIRKST